MRILNTEPGHWGPEARKILCSMGELTEEAVSREKLLQIISHYEVLLVKLDHQIDTEILQRAHKLKVIVTPTTGLDHIDLSLAQRRGIEVLSLKGRVDFLNNITATAEHTWALLLSLVRRLPHAYQDVLGGNWRRDRFRGVELKGKNLGIIGYGRLGRMVADYGRAFRMKIYAHDAEAGNLSDNNLQAASMEELLEVSDVVTLHVPLSEETKNLIDRKQFSLMKPNALLINTSRGGVVNEEALIEALLNRRIAGAALDVLAGEESHRRNNPEWPADDPLVEYAENHDNLILTPHLGGATVDSLEATELFMVHQLKNYIQSSQS